MNLALKHVLTCRISPSHYSLGLNVTFLQQQENVRKALRSYNYNNGATRDQQPR